MVLPADNLFPKRDFIRREKTHLLLSKELSPLGDQAYFSA